MLSNDDLKAILEKRVAEFESSDKKEARQIDETYVQNLLKLLSLPNDFLPIAKRAFEIIKFTLIVSFVPIEQA